VDYAEVCAGLPWHHRDPFDRLIIAQAQIEALSVISGDPQFDAYGITRIW
jgi:PIN domain nuclease of toxin-antitoxin system